ncbi:uncharacterized protein [Oncorhynchus clarkii lewisi]|uniref:uncharacterized protein n=1 Tax=Oncorhynchus clarkii lewisi TaxID=490388 RepID=UPI0039B89C01
MDVSYSCITLLECVNVDHTEHWTCNIVSGASGEMSMLHWTCIIVSGASGEMSMLHWTCIIVSGASGEMSMLHWTCIIVSGASGEMSMLHWTCIIDSGASGEMSMLHWTCIIVSGASGEPGEESRQPMNNEETGADNPLLNGDARVNDETKEATPGAQSPGPPQMNEGSPLSDRAAEETTALLDKQALDKDQVTKPPELITPIAYRGMNKPFEAHLSDKVINVNNSAVILSECLNLTFKFFHVLQGKVEECHLYYIVAEREHVAMITINLTDNLTDTSDNTSGNGDKATSHTKEITAGVLVILVLLLGIVGFLVYRYVNIPWRDKHSFALAQLTQMGRDYLNTNRENQRDNGEPDDPAAGDAESLRSALVIGRDQGDGVEEEREPPHSQESSLLNGHLVNSRQGERGEPSKMFVQPMREQILNSLRRDMLDFLW